MPRPRTIAIGAFALLLLVATALLVPRGGGSTTARSRPSGEQKPAALLPADAVGYGAVTPDLQREIDRVVHQGLTLGRVSARQTPRAAGGRAWSAAPTSPASATASASAGPPATPPRSGRAPRSPRQTWRRGRSPTAPTGDLDVLDTCGVPPALDPAARADGRARRADPAARSVAKVWLLRHEIQGVPLPGRLPRRPPRGPGHHVRGPGLAATTTATAARRRRAPRPSGTTPSAATILSTRRVAEQAARTGAAPPRCR